MIKEIARISEQEGVTIDLYIGPDKAMTISVIDCLTGHKDFVCINTCLDESDILGFVRDTVRRAKE